MSVSLRYKDELHPASICRCMILVSIAEGRSDFITSCPLLFAAVFFSTNEQRAVIAFAIIVNATTKLFSVHSVTFLPVYKHQTRSLWHVLTRCFLMKQSRLASFPTTGRQ